MEANRCIHGDVREVLPTLPGESVQMCVTSPPYWGLRDYGAEGQLGLEPTPEAYVENMVAVFREVWRVLRADGVLWLNLGDSYAGGGRGPAGESATVGACLNGAQTMENRTLAGLKPKDLVGIPWRVAFALQADGWYLRQDIIWSKLNPMPESVTDRCTKAHEYLFMFSKSARYFYDAEAIAEPAKYAGDTVILGAKSLSVAQADGSGKPRSGNANADSVTVADNRNRRSVWTVATQPYADAHFAVFPPKLIEPCVMAGSRPGDVVLDPFFGSGTTGEVAERLGRRWLGVELNGEYIDLANRRTAQMGLTL